VRIHDPELQELVMRDVLELSEAERASFGHLLAALKSGAPPHGGMALGTDYLSLLEIDCLFHRRLRPSHGYFMWNSLHPRCYRIP